MAKKSRRQNQRTVGTHWCGGTLLADGRRAVRCAKCDRVKFREAETRPPRLANGTRVHVKSDHFAEECDGVVTKAEYDAGWLYRVKPTRGDPPAIAKNKEGEYWFWDFEVTPLGQ